MLPTGTITKFGKIAAIGWVGERYYWMVDKQGQVSMLPATVVEDLPAQIPIDAPKRP